MWLFVALLVVVAAAVLTLLIRVVIRTTICYDHVPDLHGKTIVVTGASNGLGLCLAETLVKHGARVITINRYLDDINFVQHFASEIARTEENIHYLINNAGTLRGSELSADGVDKMMAVNFVGHFLLTRLLLPSLLRRRKDNASGGKDGGGPARVVHVTCGRFTDGNVHRLFDMQRNELPEGTVYNIWEWYSSSKLGLYLLSRELSRRYKSDELCSVCVDPGPLSTTFYTRLPQPQRTVWCLLSMLMFRSTEEGVQSVLFALFDDQVRACSGLVIKDCKVYDPSDAEFLRKTRSVNMSERVWNITEQLIENKLDKAFQLRCQKRAETLAKMGAGSTQASESGP